MWEERVAREGQKILYRVAGKMHAGAGRLDLEQSQFLCTLNGVPSFVYVQLAVDALQVRTDGAGGDLELLGNVRIRQPG